MGERRGEEWIENKVVKLQNFKGDIPELSLKISQIRTWTYISNHHLWIQKPIYWQEKTQKIENELSDTSYDLIIIGLGANDMLRRINPDQTKQNLEDIINIITSNNIKIILAGMVASPTNGLNYKKKFDKIYPDLSKKFELELIPFLLKGVALNPSLNQNDGIHPNEKAQPLIANFVYKSLKTYLE